MERGGGDRLQRGTAGHRVRGANSPGRKRKEEREERERGGEDRVQWAQRGTAVGVQTHQAGRGTKINEREREEARTGCSTSQSEGRRISEFVDFRCFLKINCFG